jgi:hypothetical protein
MSVFTLDKDHPLTRAGLRFVHAGQKAELGRQPGDVVLEFPYGLYCRHRHGLSAGANNSAGGRHHDHSQGSHCGSGILQ